MLLYEREHFLIVSQYLLYCDLQEDMQLLRFIQYSLLSLTFRVLIFFWRKVVHPVVGSALFKKV